MANTICRANLYQAFPEATRSDIDAIVKEVGIIADLYTRDPQAANKVFKDFVATARAGAVFKNHIMLQDLLAKTAVMDYLANPAFQGDRAQATQSMFMITRSNVEGAGSNIELQTMTRKQNYINNVHSYLANKGIFEQVRSGIYDKDVWIAIASGDTSKLNSTASEMATVLKHATTVLHKDYVNAGLMVAYRPDFVVPRVYSAQKIHDMGLEGFAMKYMAHVDLKKTFPDVPVSDMRKLYDHLQSGRSLKELVIDRKDPNSDTSMFENLLAKEIMDDFNKNTIYDEYTDSELSSLIVTHNTHTGTPLGERKIKGRSIQFMSPEHEYEFWRNLSPYNSVLEAYMGYANRSAKDISIMDKFGPKPEETVKLMKDMNSKVMDAGKATTLNSDIDRWWLNTKGFKAGERSIPNIIVNDVIIPATAAKLLGMAGLSNLRDANTTYFHYLIKSSEDPLTAIFKVGTNYLAAYMESAKLIFQSEEQGLKYLIHHSESFLKEVEDGISSQKSLFSKAASMQNIISGTKFVNRASHIANYRLYTEILLDAVEHPERLSEAQHKYFKKFGLSSEDIKFVGGLLRQYKGPTALSNGLLALEDTSIFANNPRGMQPELYRNSVAVKIGNYLNDSIRTGAPVPGMRERDYGNFKQADPNNIFALTGKLLTNFKSILFKITMDAHASLGLVANSESKAGIYQDPKSWGYAIPLLVGGVSMFVIVDMMKKLLKGHSIDDQLREIEKDKFHFAANAIGRSDVLGFMGDFAVKASKPADIMSALSTPAVDTVLLGGNLAWNMANGAVNKGHPINKASARSATDLADKFVPFTNMIWLGPMTEKYIQAKKDLAKNLAR